MVPGWHLPFVFRLTNCPTRCSPSLSLTLLCSPVVVAHGPIYQRTFDLIDLLLCHSCTLWGRLHRGDTERPVHIIINPYRGSGLGGQATDQIPFFIRPTTMSLINSYYNNNNNNFYHPLPRITSHPQMVQHARTQHFLCHRNNYRLIWSSSSSTYTGTRTISPLLKCLWQPHNLIPSTSNLVIIFCWSGGWWWTEFNQP